MRVVPSEPMFYSALTDKEGVETEAVYVRADSLEQSAASAIAGKIVFVDLPYQDLPYDLLGQVAYFKHDPNNTIGPGYTTPMTWESEKLAGLYYPAASKGAAAFVGISPVQLRTYSLCPRTDAVSGTLGPIPGLILRKEDGSYAKSLLEKGSVKARIVSCGSTVRGTTSNVVGMLPGKTEDDIILIGSHHDAMWEGAVEECSGCGILLALAKYFAQFPRESRAKTFVFVVDAGEQNHEMGGNEFVARHASGLLPKVVAEVHIEHIAREFREEGAELRDTGLVQPRGLFTSDNEHLIELAKAAVIKNNLERTFILPTTTPLGVPSDAIPYWRAGLPICSFVSAPIYWNAAEDTLDKVAVEQLEPVTSAFIELVQGIDSTERSLIRPEGVNYYQPDNDPFYQRAAGS